MKMMRVSDEVWAKIRRMKFEDGMKDYDAVLRLVLALGDPKPAPALAGAEERVVQEQVKQVVAKKKEEEHKTFLKKL